MVLQPPPSPQYASAISVSLIHIIHARSFCTAECTPLPLPLLLSTTTQSVGCRSTRISIRKHLPGTYVSSSVIHAQAKTDFGYRKGLPTPSPPHVCSRSLLVSNSPAAHISELPSLERNGSVLYCPPGHEEFRILAYSWNGCREHHRC